MISFKFPDDYDSYSIVFYIYSAFKFKSIACLKSPKSLLNELINSPIGFKQEYLVRLNYLSLMAISILRIFFLDLIISRR